MRGSFTEILSCLWPDYSPILSYREFAAVQTALVFWYNTLSCITRWDICNKLSKTSSPFPLLCSNPLKNEVTLGVLNNTKKPTYISYSTSEFL